jgi:hypothetical protein
MLFRRIAEGARPLGFQVRRERVVGDDERSFGWPLFLLSWWMAVSLAFPSAPLPKPGILL